MATIFRDDIIKFIFLNENEWISMKISLKFVPKGPISNIPALVKIMAWSRSDILQWEESHSQPRCQYRIEHEYRQYVTNILCRLS